jgi:hypothetical protein
MLIASTLAVSMLSLAGCPGLYNDIVANLPDTVTVELTNGIETTTVTGIVVGNDVVWGGDIIAGPVPHAARGFITSDLKGRWPNRTVPIDWNAIASDTATTAALQTATQAWSAATGIQFPQRTTEPDYLVPDANIIPETCGSSSVGRVGGAQTIHVASGCAVSSTIHELGHALGLLHEHQRLDRDSYIQVHLENLSGESGCTTVDWNPQFEKVRLEGFLSGPYDVQSIMHYPGATSCSKVDAAGASLPLITDLAGAAIPHNIALTNGDICSVLEMYDLDAFHAQGCYTGTPDCIRSQGDVTWSCNGPIPGAHCLLLDEPNDGDGWDDNYLCGESVKQMRWFHTNDVPDPGPGCAWSCAVMNEGAEPAEHDWANNQLCVRHCSQGASSCFQLSFSESGPIPGKACLQLYEPNDPHTWGDNYLCWNLGCGGT